jgi:hypothetical protein
MLSAGKLSGGLADFGEVFSHCPQQHDEQQGRKAQRRKGVREGGLLILDQEEVSHFTYKDTHTHKA